MPQHPGTHGQQTDEINSKPLVDATQADNHGLSERSLGTTQEIARQRIDRPNTLGESGGENPGASIK